MELFHLINPINHARLAEDVERYRVEPYVVAGDVYAHPMHVGRGGWTWYTGSAGWMYQAAVHSLLGIQRTATTIRVAPCIPTVWPHYSVEWTIDGTRYLFTVLNPEHRSHGIAWAELDGVSVDANAIPLKNDHEPHEVRIMLGATARVQMPMTTAGLASH
jgi:cyclic beta-1,2-glucan synthetase